MVGRELHNSDIVMVDGELEVVLYPQQNSFFTNRGLRRSKCLIVNEVSNVKEHTAKIFEEYADEIEKGKEKELKQLNLDVPLYYVICIHGVVDGKTPEPLTHGHFVDYIQDIIKDSENNNTNRFKNRTNSLSPDSKLYLSLIPILSDQRTKSDVRNIVSKYVADSDPISGGVIIVRDDYCIDNSGVKFAINRRNFGSKFRYSKNNDKMYQIGTTWSTRVSISNMAFTEKNPACTKPKKLS